MSVTISSFTPINSISGSDGTSTPFKMYFLYFRVEFTWFKVIADWSNTLFPGTRFVAPKTFADVYVNVSFKIYVYWYV